MTSRPSSWSVWLLGALLALLAGLVLHIGRGEPQTTPASGMRFQQTGTDLGRATIFNCSTGLTCTLTGSVIEVVSTGGGGGAPTTATYLTNVPDAGLSNEQALSLLATGFMFSTTTTGAVTTLTATQVTAALNVFTSVLQGLVPASGGGTANFLRADGSWAAPAGGGSGTVTNTGGALTLNALMLGAGGADSKVLASLGTTTTVLHGNAAGAPTFAQVVSGDLNITTTSCTNQAVTAISAGGVGTCATVTNAMLANSAITINGTSVSLGGTRALTLASADFVNQGATSTVLHGNAAGNPAFGSVVTADIGANQVTLAKLATQADLTLLGNISGGAAVPTASTLTAILDAILGTTQGAVLYRNATVWTTLAPGTSGQVLQSGGAAANISWLTLAGGGNVSNTGTPTSGQLALWTNATTIQGVTALPAANFPALTGDVTTSAASLATTIAANAVTTAKILDANVTLAKIVSASAASVLLGRGSAAGAGVYQEITLGSGLTMTNQVLSASGGSSGSSTTASTVRPSDATMVFAVNSLTVRQVVHFTVPLSITVNAVSLRFTSATTPGTMRTCIYPEDGSSLLINPTPMTPVANSTVTASVSAVVLPAGSYYAVVGCATTCSNSVVGAPSEAQGLLWGSGAPTSKLKYHGTVTHTSGTCNSTLGTVTGTTDVQLAVRLDT